MKFLRFTTLLAVPLALVLQACGGQMNPAGPAQGMDSMAIRPLSKKPPQCANQSTTTLYATSATMTLQSKPRALCIPAFGGWGGTLQYPAANPSVTVVAISSTTNYNQQLPLLSSKGKPVFYLQMTTSAATKFGPTVNDKGGLTSKSLVPGTTYYVYGQVKFPGPAGIFIPFTPCSAKATAGPYGGVIMNAGTLFAKQNFQQGGAVTIEVYKVGKEVKAAC